MNSPFVTVLMPVYNAERFLKRAIESVLEQTFTDFEFLIINDGSTDGSVAIIQSFKDHRIRLVHNAKNIGLVATLNKGLELANSKYIARMDADDISLPERFKKQINYMESHPDVAVLATLIEHINAVEEEIGYWIDDKANLTAQEIYTSMAKTASIAHPTVFIRTSIAKDYMYNSTQREGEDWDLWMRLLSDGKKIEKIPEVLLKYRMHAASFTATNNRKFTIEEKVNKIKITFLKQRLKSLRIGKFEILVMCAILRTLARDIKINRLPHWLRFWKRMLTLSPIRAYREFSLLKKTVEQKKNENGIFFFFPYTHVGGAEKVHALITETVKDKKPWIFFTGFSDNKKFLPLFQDNGLLLDVSVGINHPFFIKRSIKLVVMAIERAKDPVVLGCNNLFFYDLIPYLSSKVKVIDLMHDFRFDGEEQVFKSYLLKFLRCDQRVFISERAISQTKKFYRMNSVEEMYTQRLVYIPNYVNIPALYTEKSEGMLQILYVGRGTAEKRAYLVTEIAQACVERKMNVQFTIVGDIARPSDLKNSSSVVFTGELTDTEKLKELYKKADVLLITSQREGFPMAIMEGMAYGVIPVSTPVGDIPKHIRNDETGYLTTGIAPETVVNEMIGYLSLLVDQREKRTFLNRQAYEYAKKNFSKEKFTAAYRALLIDNG